MYVLTIVRLLSSPMGDQTTWGESLHITIPACKVVILNAQWGYQVNPMHCSLWILVYLQQEIFELQKIGYGGSTGTQW